MAVSEYVQTSVLTNLKSKSHTEMRLRTRILMKRTPKGIRACAADEYSTHFSDPASAGRALLRVSMGQLRFGTTEVTMQQPSR